MRDLENQNTARIKSLLSVRFLPSKRASDNACLQCGFLIIYVVVKELKNNRCIRLIIYGKYALKMHSGFPLTSLNVQKNGIDTFLRFQSL